MHVASADICFRIGDCLDSHDPPAVLAADAVYALDAAGISRGVVFSSAYLYGLPALALAPQLVERYTRLENEFTAAEVARYPEQLTGFLSVHPLSGSALDEIAHWRGNNSLVGLKLHLTASGADLRNEKHRVQLKRVLRAAAAQTLPVVMHIGGGSFGTAETRLLIEELLPSVGDGFVQIAHAAGGYPVMEGRQAEILNEFADYIERDDPRTRHLFFDLSYVPAPDLGAKSVSLITSAIRRIGIDRFLFGSDYNVLTPAEELLALDRLELNANELNKLRENCAPWACTTPRQARDQDGDISK